MHIIAKTFQGLESVLAEELRTLGYQEVKESKRAVTFKTNKEGLYRANYLLRTCLRLLVSLEEFDVHNEQQLYNAVQSIDWSKYIKRSGSFAIDTVVNSSIFTHSKYVAYKTKDAIVDQFRNRMGKRPDVDTQSPDVRINVFINQDNMKISLDSSGESLHKRNYRMKSVAAPINEVLGAGLIALSGWDQSQILLDPMCGSGTIAIEALMKLQNRPSQYFKNEFGFATWKDFEFELWNKIKKEENDKMVSPSCKIYANDIDMRAIGATELNLKRMRAPNAVKTSCKDFFAEEIFQENCFMIFNPPYDKRLEIEDDTSYYQNIGDTLKQKYNGSTAWIFSGNVDAIKHVGLKTSQRLHLFNGPIPCKFHKFDIH